MGEEGEKVSMKELVQLCNEVLGVKFREESQYYIGYHPKQNWKMTLWKQDHKLELSDLPPVSTPNYLVRVESITIPIGTVTATPGNTLWFDDGVSILIIHGDTGSISFGLPRKKPPFYFVIGEK